MLKRITAALFVVVLLAQPTVPAAARPVRVTVELQTDRLIEGAHAKLDRLKYFSLCDGGAGFYQRVPGEDEARYLLDTLNVSFGRSLGLCTGYTQAARWNRIDGIQEDPARPGYIAPASIRDVAKVINRASSTTGRSTASQ